MIGVEEIVAKWQVQGGGRLGEREWSVVRRLVDAYNDGGVGVLASMLASVEDAVNGLRLIDEKRMAALILFTRMQCDRMLARENPALLFCAEMERGTSSFIR